MVNKIIILLLFLLYSCSSYVIEDESASKKLDIVKTYIEDQKYSKAKIELEYLIMYDPLSEFAADAQYYLSECFFYLGDYSQAIIEYERYLSRPDYKPDYITYPVNLLDDTFNSNDFRQTENPCAGAETFCDGRM